jgi:hypothetical protein
MELEIEPLGDDAIRLQGRLLRVEKRVPVSLLDPEVERSSRTLQTCCWCLRLRDPGGGWIDMEEALPRSQPFSEESPPRLEHTACEACERRVVGALEGIARR